MENEEFLAVTLPAMDRVYNLARRLTARREDAEDLVQDTYLAALKAWRERRRPRRVEPWLVTICLNLARSSYRRRSRRPHEVQWEEIASVASPDVSEEALAELDRASVHRALRALSDEQRVAIALVDLSGFTVAEAARIARVPRGTVLSRLHRGRKGLAALLLTDAKEGRR